ncbi:MAG: cupin domain-containing protein [Actinomycetota bacterium]|nr:cupin domain-containing protein [Actinomycetota bacterium]
MNVFGADFEYDESDPAGFRSGVAAVGKAAGGEALTVKLYEVPPGENLCPYHYEYEEEWLIVLDGAVVLRAPDGERELARGEIVCFPPGPAGAHKVTNRDERAARVLMFSSAREPAVAVYPDSGKVGVWTGNSEDEFMFRRSDGAVDYYEGEAWPRLSR